MSLWADVVKELERLTSRTAKGSLMNQAAQLFEIYVGQSSSGSFSTRIAAAAGVLGSSPDVSALNRAASSVSTTSFSGSAINRLRQGLGVLDPLWTPSAINTEGWWDASDLSTITVDTGGVSQLDDLSGNVQHLTQPAEGARPATGIHALNGLNMLFYNGTDAMATYGDNFAIPASGNFSVFQVGEVFLPLDNVADGMFGMLCAGECSDWQFVGGVNVNNFNGRIVANELGGVNTNFTPAMEIGPSLYNVVFDFSSSSITAYLSGTARNETVAYTIKVTDPQTFIVMSNRVGNALAGHGGETIIIEDVSEATRQKVEGYATWKWGLESQLPAGHPYKNRAPLES